MNSDELYDPEQSQESVPGTPDTEQSFPPSTQLSPDSRRDTGGGASVTKQPCGTGACCECCKKKCSPRAPILHTSACVVHLFPSRRLCIECVRARVRICVSSRYLYAQERSDTDETGEHEQQAAERLTEQERTRPSENSSEYLYIQRAFALCPQCVHERQGSHASSCTCSTCNAVFPLWQFLHMTRPMETRWECSCKLPRHKGVTYLQHLAACPVVPVLCEPCVEGGLSTRVVTRSVWEKRHRSLHRCLSLFQELQDQLLEDPADNDNQPLTRTMRQFEYLLKKERDKRQLDTEARRIVKRQATHDRAGGSDHEQEEGEEEEEEQEY